MVYLAAFWDMLVKNGLRRILDVFYSWTYYLIKFARCWIINSHMDKKILSSSFFWYAFEKSPINVGHTRFNSYAQQGLSKGVGLLFSSSGKDSMGTPRLTVPFKSSVPISDHFRCSQGKTTPKCNVVLHAPPNFINESVGTVRRNILLEELSLAHCQYNT